MGGDDQLRAGVHQVMDGHQQREAAPEGKGRFGLIQSKWLAEKRRIALVVIYILSALLTPGPDPVTALMLFVPSYLLYEGSIVTARWGAGAA